MTRIVITGLGVVAPNGVGLADFEQALRTGRSGVTFRPEMAELNFGCQVAGVPPVTEEHRQQYFSDLTLRHLKSTGVMYATIAGLEAWQDAGLSIPEADEAPDWDSGCVFGTGMVGAEVLRDGALLVDAGKVKRLGSRTIEQGMGSGPSAALGGRLGLGNRVSSNSSACATGTEAILMAAERIQQGKAKRMLAGSCDSQGIYVWGGFDAMRVLNRRSNDAPEKASRPMSASAKGFVPGAGAGALVLESLETAQARGAQIYAELLGGSVNAGGQRLGGSMTAPNPTGVRRCMSQGLAQAGVSAAEIDLISGHLTATMGDPLEIANWVEVLNRRGKDFPYLQSLKSLVGHCLSAAGSIETVAAVLQLYRGFIHPSVNSEDLHPEIESLVERSRIPLATVEVPIQTVAKASFGFGDVNAFLVLKKWAP
ncbi:MAG: beta-ketoacyl-[acyl-carrier-protein] synthase family protein [Bacteroidota bacterium]